MNKQEQLKRQKIREKRHQYEREKRKEFLKWRHSNGVKKYLEELGRQKVQIIKGQTKEKKKLKNRIKFVILLVAFFFWRIWQKIKNKIKK